MNPYEEELLPTVYHDRDGREYSIHINGRVMAEISRRFNLTLAEMQSPASLPVHVLIGIAEIGSRQEWIARNKQTTDDWYNALTDANVNEALEAAVSAVVNFTLRGSRRLSPEERGEICRMILAERATAEQEKTGELARLLEAGRGSTSTGSPESLG